MVVAGKENAIPVKTAAASDSTTSCSNRSHNPAAASHTAAGACSNHQHGDVTCAPAVTASQHHHHASFSSNTLSQHSHGTAAGATPYTCTAGYSTLSVTSGGYASNQHTSAAYVTDQYNASTTTSWCSSSYNSYTNGSTSQVPPSSQQADITLPPPAMQYHVNDVNNHMLYPGTCYVLCALMPFCSCSLHTPIDINDAQPIFHHQHVVLLLTSTCTST